MAAFDSTRPAQGNRGRSALVQAILAGDITAETDWVEWKSRVQLNTKAWQGEIATHVLGLANRDPAKARRTVGGYGYVVLGVEPGQTHTLTIPDPADLEAWISRYTGAADGPRWEPFAVTVDGNEVLIIEVAPPAQGDPIYSVRREFQDPRGRTVPAGTIPVRRLGKTERPQPADIDILSRRAGQQSGSELLLSLDWWNEPETLQLLDTSEAVEEEWLARERARLLGPMKAAQFPNTSLVAAMMISGIGENRSVDQYTEQVEAYLASARGHFRDLARARAVADGFGKLQLAIVNETEHNFEAVAVELYIVGDAAAFFDEDEADDECEYPSPPRVWGADRFRSLGLGPINIPKVKLRGPGHIDNTASARIRCEPFHVRPGYRHALPSFHLLLGPRPEHTVEIEWHATATNVSGSASGTFEIRLGAPVSGHQFLA